MSDALLSLNGVHTHIGPYHILQGVDLEVPRGGVTVLLGRNGAGKTTTLRTIMGLWQASKGTIQFDGTEIQKETTPAIAQREIAFVPEDMGIFTDLTVHENMLLAARNNAIDEERLGWIFGLFPPLKTFWQSAAGNLSGGQKQMLAVARAIIEPRKLILIDEPTKGLAPAIINAMIAALKELKEMQTTILLVEQNFSMARAVGDTVAVMDDGRIVYSGDMAELAADAGLQERLMGLSLEAHQ
ncbi:High-affinity branched-chain amino acid transport ATP-binding protein LivF [Pseudovibrio sp. Ad13]|uniref:ABC transporter ATP-binding protein n=1 Tax=Pseudovibrio sp. Ad13 TaxID=989396 RepID=UPI0007AE997D|nr:ABC transporter ATP-binding protein [Pseudovibrio sp. Ad13]KZK86127.1 High-affinity branched-chain amino acid transport ATP-binding protein LivF [Pseudovibrio sp. Ad13]